MFFPCVSVVDEADVSFPCNAVWLFLCTYEVNVGAFYANGKDVGKGAIFTINVYLNLLFSKFSFCI